jgi:membrane-bound lytic murein transglycosylase B
MSKKKRHYLYVTIAVFCAIFSTSVISYAQTQSRAELEAQLKALETEIENQKSAIRQKQQEAAGLSRDVSILGSKVTASQARIKAQSIQIQNLSGDINEKVDTIRELTVKSQQQRQALAQVLRKKNELDASSFTDFLLSSETLTDFFGDEDSYQKVQQALKQSFTELNNNKIATEQVKESLEEKKDDAETLKELQEIERQKAVAAQNQKAQILRVTRGQEANYKKALVERERDAARIRSALFALQDGTSIQFGTLYDFARRAESATGVRASFIMAILSQETNLGRNVGQCFLKDSGGQLVSIRDGSARGEMRPNSVQPFLSITQAVGRDPFKTRVSCAFQGWGGAMGISQFMPATWMTVKKRIEDSTGASYADPWNNYHAILASGLYLRDLGAAARTQSAERNAACRYYSGRVCSASSAAAAYGNSVLRKEAAIEAQIEQLQ